MKYDLNILNDYIERGLIIKQVHPTLPLSIYNYSRTCQYDKLWDEITLNCRGLVLDNEGNVIAKPFPKFFNYEEYGKEDIPWELFDVYEKMDGSLGICFHYNGEWYMATRGSFTSEQAKKGILILESKYDLGRLSTKNTYLFEIIYDSNRIVCKYDYEDVILLGAYNIDDCNEVDVQTNYYQNYFNVVLAYKTWGESFDELKKEIPSSKEGYVIRFKNGMRMKIKGDEYVRLHRILTNFSTTDIWELLRTNGNMDEFLDRVPDEFDNWVRMIVLELKAGFENIKFRSSIDFEYYKGESNGDKKQFALAIENNEYRSILFSMWDGKSYEDTIWKMIKPKWSKPFKKDIDN
jgi:RNA ligase